MEITLLGGCSNYGNNPYKLGYGGPTTMVKYSHSVHGNCANDNDHMCKSYHPISTVDNLSYDNFARLFACPM